MASIQPKYKTVKFAEINVDFDQNIRTVTDVTELRESIEEIGLQAPLGVTAQEDGTFNLIYGFRRASCLIDIHGDDDKVKVPVAIYDKADEADVLLLKVQENTARKELNPTEEARALGRLIDLQIDEERIRKTLGWSKTLLTQRKAILDYSVTLQDALADYAITVNQARKISLLEDDRHDEFVELASSLPVKALSDLVDQALQPEDEELDEIVEDDEEEVVEDTDIQPEFDPTVVASSIRVLLSDLLDLSLDDLRPIAFESMDKNSLNEFERLLDSTDESADI